MRWTFFGPPFTQWIDRIRFVFCSLVSDGQRILQLDWRVGPPSHSITRASKIKNADTDPGPPWSRTSYRIYSGSWRNSGFGRSQFARSRCQSSGRYNRPFFSLHLSIPGFDVTIPKKTIFLKHCFASNWCDLINTQVELRVSKFSCTLFRLCLIMWNMWHLGVWSFEVASFFF